MGPRDVKDDVFSFIKLNIKTEREKNDASKCRNWHRYQRKTIQFDVCYDSYGMTRILRVTVLALHICTVFFIHYNL